MKLRKRAAVSIKWRIFSSIAILVGLLLTALWIFQICLLEPFYLNIKKGQVRSATQQIVEQIDQPNLDARLEELSKEYQACITIVDNMGYVLHDVAFSRNCIIHKFNAVSYLGAYLLTEENGGSYMEVGETLRDKEYRKGAYDIAPREMLLLTLAPTESHGTVLILVNSTVSSVAATKETLQVQLLWITIVTAAVAVVVALLLSLYISRPISKIHESAKKLSTGDYQVEFAESGYREIQELAATLNYAAAELAKVDNLQRDLIANISHDLRTPLTMIIGYGEMMRDLPGENNPENVQVIIDEAKRLTSLVNDVLDISKLQSGDFQLEVTTFDLTEQLQEILYRYEKMSDYTIVFQADRAAYVKGDLLKLSQVFYNLMNNAVTYTGADKKITVTQSCKEHRVRVTVTDTGEGIAAEQLQDIWRRYYKVDKTHRRAQIGSGLGLSIVKTVLDLHPGAAYGVDSTLGVGSSFWFELNLEENPES